MKMLDVLQSETGCFQPRHHQLVGRAGKKPCDCLVLYVDLAAAVSGCPRVGGHSLLKNYFDKSVWLAPKGCDATCTTCNFFTVPVNRGLAWLVTVVVTCRFHISHTWKLCASLNSLWMSSSKPRQEVREVLRVES